MAVCGITHTLCSWSYLANIKRGSIRYNHRIQDCFYLRTVKTGTVLWHRTVHNPYEWELPWKKGGSCGGTAMLWHYFWSMSITLASKSQAAKALLVNIVWGHSCVFVKICVLHGERFNTDLISSKQVLPYASRQGHYRTPSDQPH